jgi:predicted XRE-type DNA-binding protein
MKGKSTNLDIDAKEKGLIPRQRNRPQSLRPRTGPAVVGRQFRRSALLGSDDHNLIAAAFNSPGRPRSEEPSMARSSKGPRLTADVAARIKHLWATTDLKQHEIAARFGINQGRVSEVLSGKRFPDVPAQA